MSEADEFERELDAFWQRQERKEVYTYTLTLYRLGGVDATDEELYAKYFPAISA